MVIATYLAGIILALVGTALTIFDSRESLLGAAAAAAGFIGAILVLYSATGLPLAQSAFRMDELAAYRLIDCFELCFAFLVPTLAAIPVLSTRTGRSLLIVAWLPSITLTAASLLDLTGMTSIVTGKLLGLGVFMAGSQLMGHPLYAVTTGTLFALIAEVGSVGAFLFYAARRGDPVFARRCTAGLLLYFGSMLTRDNMWARIL